MILRLPITVSVAILAASPAGAQVTREEALRLAYPGAVIKAERLFLSPTQQEAITHNSVDPPSPLVARYVATLDGTPVGRAYVDTHTVRTKKESLLICLDEDGRVKRVDVTAFLEPPEYRASEFWLGQYRGQALREELELSRAIRPLAGATLTARAVNAAVRRVLTIDQALTEGSR